MAHANHGSIPNRLLRGEITRRWQQLTNSDIDGCTADRSRLIELLQARYGYARRRAEKEVELFFGEFWDRLRQTA
ncbi:MAG: CsbD family protein [Acidobacteria bacterium]|nr:MAG: CsbD family protein [Acidobacteriota bacterium]PYS14822.1 MAG: CsbD family protein [Acidobacteriota bacterium]